MNSDNYTLNMLYFPAELDNNPETLNPKEQRIDMYKKFQAWKNQSKNQFEVENLTYIDWLNTPLGEKAAKAKPIIKPDHQKQDNQHSEFVDLGDKDFVSDYVNSAMKFYTKDQFDPYSNLQSVQQRKAFEKESIKHAKQIQKNYDSKNHLFSFYKEHNLEDLYTIESNIQKKVLQKIGSNK